MKKLNALSLGKSLNRSEMKNIRGGINNPIVKKCDPCTQQSDCGGYGNCVWNTDCGEGGRCQNN